MIRIRDANNKKIHLTHQQLHLHIIWKIGGTTIAGAEAPTTAIIHRQTIISTTSKTNHRGTVSEHLMPSWREQTHSECNEDSSITCDKNRTGATRNQLYNRKIFATKMRLKPNQISIIYVCRILWTCVIIFIDCTLNMYKCISHHQHLVPLNGLVRAMPLHTR